MDRPGTSIIRTPTWLLAIRSKWSGRGRRSDGKEVVVTPFEAGAQVWSNEALMRRIVQSGGPLSRHVKELYLDYKPPEGTSLWSMMWDELTVASLIDPSVVKKSATMYLDVDISHGPSYGHTLIWKPEAEVPHFFLPYSGPDAPDLSKWVGHLKPPEHLHPASVQLDIDVQKFDDVFVRAMSQ